MERIVPYITGMQSEDFLNLIERHGLAGHPAMLSLLAEVGELYQSGRGQLPSGNYAGMGNNLSFYQTPEAMKILGNSQHPQYKAYYEGLRRATNGYRY